MITVREAQPGDADVVGTIFAEAFRDDPAWAMFFPRAESRRDKLRQYYRRAVRRHPERVDVAESDGVVLGAVLWSPPVTGSRSGPTAWARRLLTAAKTLVRQVLVGQPRRSVEHSRAIDSHRPTEPHWYLTDIAADPAARGRGVGSTLLAHRLELIDATGARPVFLESTTAGSRRLYERFGFRAVGTVETEPGQASTAMVRAPRSPE